MSSSFTDQPHPRDPQRDPGYTPTPPAPGPNREADDDQEAPLPRLGSLAQTARGKELQKAKRILLAIGVLTVLVNLVGLFTTPTLVKGVIDQEIIKAGGHGRVDPVRVQEETDRLLVLNYLLDGVFLFLGVLFVIFGLLIYRFPVPATIISLTLYLLATLSMALIDPLLLVSGVIFRIIFVVALAKAIQSALAYEKSRRAAEEYGPL